ncbi:MAG: cation diffusion facilitator family transporter [Pseudohongiellaceae bacterium]
MSAELAQSRHEYTRVTLVGMALDIVLGLVKIFGGALIQSFALVADGIHSLTDAVTDIFVLVIARVAQAEPDARHPYGHGRFETLGTIGMGVVFFITAGILIYDGIDRLQSAVTIPVPGAAGIAIALVSIAGKEWIYHYTMRVARRLKSSLLKANAWHSRSDALSSVAVLIGLVAARQGYPWMDAVAAIVVALLIARIGWELCADALRELVDTAVPKARQNQLRDCIMEVEGVRGIISLRSRLSGGQIILEVHLLVNPRITVSEGHQLGETARRELIGRFSDIGDVIVHIDPENHDQERSIDPREQLPRRQVVLEAIRERWRLLLDDSAIERVALHYLEHGIEVELVLQLEKVPPDLTRQLEESIADLDYLAALNVYHPVCRSRLQRPPLS